MNPGFAVERLVALLCKPLLQVLLAEARPIFCCQLTGATLIAARICSPGHLDILYV